MSVWLSQQRAATHLEVSVHNIMLVDMIDTLQDLTNAMAVEKEGQTETKTCQSLSIIIKDITYTPLFDLSVMWFWLQNQCILLQHF